MFSCIAGAMNAWYESVCGCADHEIRPHRFPASFCDDRSGMRSELGGVLYTPCMVVCYQIRMFEKRHFETPHEGVLPNMVCVISSVTLFLLFAAHDYEASCMHSRLLCRHQ
jgi:hypothetical protein